MLHNGISDDLTVKIQNFNTLSLTHRSILSQWLMQFVHTLIFLGFWDQDLFVYICYLPVICFFTTVSVISSGARAEAGVCKDASEGKLK